MQCSNCGCEYMGHAYPPCPGCGELDNAATVAAQQVHAAVWPPCSGQYDALPTKAVDGDTFHFMWPVPGTCRVARINAPELCEPGGKEAKDWLTMLMPQFRLLVVLGRDKYGRTLADVQLKDGKLLSDAMVAAGHATYMGKK